PCGSPVSLVQTESRGCVSARAGSSANAPVARKRAPTSAAATEIERVIRASDWWDRWYTGEGAGFVGAHDRSAGSTESPIRETILRRTSVRKAQGFRVDPPAIHGHSAWNRTSAS